MSCSAKLGLAMSDRTMPSLRDLPYFRRRLALPLFFLRNAPGLLFLALAGSVVAAEPPAAPPSEAPTWAFSPGIDTFSPEALLDLRSLNERVAGEHGYITVTPSGDFATGDGKPIRFWAVNEYVQEQDNDAMLAHKARWLAKRGVNMGCLLLVEASRRWPPARRARIRTEPY